MDLEQPSCLKKLAQKNGVGKKIGEKGAPIDVRIYILEKKGCNWAEAQIEMTKMLGLKATFCFLGGLAGQIQNEDLYKFHRRFTWYMIVRNIKKYHCYIHLVYTKSLFYNNSTSFKIRFCWPPLSFGKKSPLDRPRRGTLWGNQSIDGPLFFGGFYGLKKHVILHIYFQHQQTTTETQPFLCCCFNMELCGGLVFIRYATSASIQVRNKTFFRSIPFQRRYIFKFLKMYVFVQPFVM